MCALQFLNKRHSLVATEHFAASLAVAYMRNAAAAANSVDQAANDISVEDTVFG